TRAQCFTVLRIDELPEIHRQSGPGMLYRPLCPVLEQSMLSGKVEPADRHSGALSIREGIENPTSNRGSYRVPCHPVNVLRGHALEPFRFKALEQENLSRCGLPDYA